MGGDKIGSGNQRGDEMYNSHLTEMEEVTLSAFEDESEYIVRALCGRDDSTAYLYNLFVALSPLPGYGDIPGLELVFSVIEISEDQTHSREIWDGLEVRKKIGEAEHRAEIMSALEAAIQHLIDLAQPKLVHMCTRTPNLPQKALAKFNRICTVFRSNGYKAGKGDPYHGRHIWMMTKEEEEGS